MHPHRASSVGGTHPSSGCSTSPTAGAAEPLQFAPCPGRLPAVVFWPVHSGYVTIGDRTSKAYMCDRTQSAFAKCQDLVDSQAGSVFVAARVVPSDGGRTWAFKFPYDMVAIKRESKVKVQEQQKRLALGYDGDNTMLDKAILTLLSGGGAAEFVPKLLECWHDDTSLYSVMEYFPKELRTRIVSCTGADGRIVGMREADTRSIMTHVCIALATLHGHGWAHRDISPENIMIADRTPPGEAVEEEVGILIDFGTAITMTPRPGGGLGSGSPPSSTATLGRVPSGAWSRSPATDGEDAVMVGGVGAGGRGGGGGEDGCTTPTGTSLGSGISTALGVPTAGGVGISPVAGSGTGLPSTAASTSGVVSFEDMVRVLPGAVVGGFSPISPPPPGGRFCKRRYADPTYVYAQHYYGVAFDLWSVAQTLYTCMEGDEMYRDPIPASDGGFHVLVKHEAACRGMGLGVSGGGEGAVMTTPPSSTSPVSRVGSGAWGAVDTLTTAHAAGAMGMDGGGAWSATPLGKFLAQRCQRRERHGLPPLSPAFQDLLCRLFRVTPQFRPLTVTAVLEHPWFTGFTTPWHSILPPTTTLATHRSDAVPAGGGGVHSKAPASAPLIPVPSWQGPASGSSTGVAGPHRMDTSGDA